jgi:hypothetical protein
MVDHTCAECERLWQAYEHTTNCQRIIEHKSFTETGLEALLRKASNRYEEAPMALEDRGRPIILASPLSLQSPAGSIPHPTSHILGTTKPIPP